MKVAVIGPTLNTYYGVEEISKYHEIKALFTLPPEIGLKKARYTTFEDLANKYNFNIFYKEHELNDENVIKKFKDLNLDLIIELGSSKIIPNEIINSSKYGCIGSHGARLPYIRGGASMNWAIINDEKNWGVSIYYLNPDVDDGIPIATRDFNINLRDDINTVHNKSDLVTSLILGEFLQDFKPKEKLPRQKNLEVIKINPSQKDYDWNKIIEWNKHVKETYKENKNSGKAIFLPQRKLQDGFIDWNSDSLDIYNFIRAQTGPFFSGAFTLYNNKKLFILKSEIDYDQEIDEKKNITGKVIQVINKKGIIVSTFDGEIIIKRLQLEGMPEMWADEFFYEYNLKIGDKLGL